MSAPAMMLLDPVELLGELAAMEQRARDFAPWAGGGTVWEAERKALWTRIADAIRVDARAKGEKITEAAIEQAAHADAEYQAFVGGARDEAARFHAANLRLIYLRAAIDYVNGENFRAGREAGLTR